MANSSLFPAPPTAFDLVMQIYLAGGGLWLDEQSPDHAIRHRAAPKVVIRQLRELDRDLVIAAMSDYERQAAGVRQWLMENTVPGRGFSTNFGYLYRRYVAFASRPLTPEFFRSALVYPVADGLVQGVIPKEDFLASLADGYEFRNGTQVRCFSCLHCERLIVVGRDVVDEENLLEVKDEHGKRFLVKEKDCCPLVPS